MFHKKFCFYFEMNECYYAIYKLTFKIKFSIKSCCHLNFTVEIAEQQSN